MTPSSLAEIPTFRRNLMARSSGQTTEALVPPIRWHQYSKLKSITSLKIIIILNIHSRVNLNAEVWRHLTQSNEWPINSLNKPSNPICSHATMVASFGITLLSSRVWLPATYSLQAQKQGVSEASPLKSLNKKIKIRIHQTNLCLKAFLRKPILLTELKIRRR
jgi:hypothetical protein